MNAGKNQHIGFKSAEKPRGKRTVHHMGDSFLGRFFSYFENAQFFESHFPLQAKAMLIYLYI